MFAMVLKNEMKCEIVSRWILINLKPMTTNKTRGLSFFDVNRSQSLELSGGFHAIICYFKNLEMNQKRKSKRSKVASKSCPQESIFIKTGSPRKSAKK